MNRFSGLLRKISDGLDLPQPDKSRILLEIASDLDDMYRFFREKGLGEEEAASRAEERLDLSNEALLELVEIHESGMRKLLGRISEQARTRWERVLLAMAVIVVAAYTGRQVFSVDLYQRAGRFVWPILLFALAALVIAIWQIYKLYIKKDHDIRTLGVGLPWLIAPGAASILTGLIGMFYEFHRSIRMAAEGAGGSPVFFVECALRCSAMMMVGLVTAIAIGIVWFILMNKVRSIEMAEAAWLID
ncbi:MAG TPA: hypothetical protein ENO08_02470 [Candidatus Eisenbacteria bacterium]|uniref:Uncharacterized protein n=1 Tax=Eiseniibacteriota bacterium TaxID=2212470 RepID=A0A7V2F3E2_UNCEI|nr:hypothetical protein [Candidatus Eisenbacteria bacterium]